jgi:hypothetical protein
VTKYWAPKVDSEQLVCCGATNDKMMRSLVCVRSFARPWTRTRVSPLLRCFSLSTEPQGPKGVTSLVRDDRGVLFDKLKLERLTREEILASVPILNTDPNVASLARAQGLQWEDKEQYVQQVTALAQKLDPRVWSIATSFLFAGISIGAIIPILPILAKEVQISAFTFSLVISSFAAARLVGNIFAGNTI